jgi:hypothetical protein
MSQHAAFYEVIIDHHPLTLTVGGDVPATNLPFHPPQNTAIDNRAVLSFTVSYTLGAHQSGFKELNLRIRLNNIQIFDLDKNDLLINGFIQIVIGVPGNNHLQPGSVNSLLCTASSASGTGVILISDMVIWYQRNI